MPSAEVLWTFFLAAAVFAYMPGPAMIYAAAQTIARGRRAGLLAALGIHIGGYVHVVAAASGLSALFRLVPEAYLAVKLAGAAYLMVIGGLMVRQALRGEAVAAPTPRSGRRAFIDSVLVEVLNPKTAIFFLAFLPQFAVPGAGLPIWAQMLVLGTIVNLMFSSADIVSVGFAGAVSRRLARSATLQRLARAVGGTVLIGLGGRLALDRS